MLLSDIFEQLTYGELSQLELGGADNEGIIKENWKRVVPHINLGMLELYKRFPIRIKELILVQREELTTYVLHPDHAVTNPNNTDKPKYIDDSIYAPYTGDLLVIDAVFNENGEELYLNETDPYIIKTRLNLVSQRAWTILTPTYNTIQIPYPIESNILTVEYKAAPDRITLEELDPSTTEVEVPFVLLNALLLFIAARAYTSLGGKSAQEGLALTAKFEQAIKQVDVLGLINRDNAVNQKLEVAGWV